MIRLGLFLRTSSGGRWSGGNDAVGVAWDFSKTSQARVYAPNRLCDFAASAWGKKTEHCRMRSPIEVWRCRVFFFFYLRWRSCRARECGHVITRNQPPNMHDLTMFFILVLNSIYLRTKKKSKKKETRPRNRKFWAMLVEAEICFSLSVSPK